jgi:microcystin-dependent protein
MPDLKITELPAIDSPVAGDLFAIVDDVAGTPATKKVTLAQLTTLILSQLYQVGDVVLSNTDPATKWGFGTWQEITGRVLVGQDTGDPDFATVGQEGGSKDVTLTEAQIPPHTHVQDAHGHSVSDPQHSHVENSNNTTTGGLRGWGAADTSTNTSTATGYSTAPASTGVTVNDATAVNQNTGGGQPHTNLPPYRVERMWKRTA